MAPNVYWVIGCSCPACMAGRRRVLEEVQAMWGDREAIEAEERQQAFWTGDRLLRLTQTEDMLEME